MAQRQHTVDTYRQAGKVFMVKLCLEFIESIRANMRLRGYSLRTEKSYLYWAHRFIHFKNMNYPRQIGAPEVKVFLTWLAVEKHAEGDAQYCDFPLSQVTRPASWRTRFLAGQ